MLSVWAVGFWLALRASTEMHLSLHSYFGSFLCALLIILWIGLFWSGLRQPRLALCLIVAAAVPLEFSGQTFGGFTFSPLDYFSLALLLSNVFREGLPTLFRHVKKVFGVSGILCWSLFFGYAMVVAFHLHGNVRSILRWGEFLIVYLLAAEAFEEAKQEGLRRLATILAVAGGLMSLLGLVQFVWARGDYRGVVGTFYQHNIMAAFLSLCLPPAVASTYFSEDPGWKKWKPIVWAIALALICSYSRGSWMGLLVGAVFAGWRFGRGHFKSRRTLMVAVGVAVLIVFLALSSRRRSIAESGQRTLYWQAGEAVLRDHPWVGLGAGNYRDHIYPYLTSDGKTLFTLDVRYNGGVVFWQHLHNFYLQIMVDYGLPGAFFLFCALGLLLRMALRHKPKHAMGMAFQVAIVAFSVHNIVDIVTVNSFDLIVALLLASCSFSPSEMERV